MKIRFFLVIVLISFKLICQSKEYLESNSIKSYSQEFVDSLITGSILVDLKEFKDVLNTNKELKGWVKYYQIKASKASKIEQFDSVIYYSNQALKIYNESEEKRSIDESVLVAVYNLKAYAYKLKEDYKKAINNYHLSINLEKKYPYKWKSFTFTGIGSCHSNLGNDSLAIEYLSRGVNDSLYMSVPRAGASTLFDIGAIYKRIGKLDKAITYFDKGIKYSYEKKHYTNISALQGETGVVKYMQGHKKEALSYFKMAIKTNSEHGIGTYFGAKENHLLFTGFVNVYEGNLYQGIKELRAVIDVFKSLDKISKPTKNAALFVFQILNEAYMLSGNTKSIALLNRESNDFLERFYKEQLNEDLQKVETQYQTKEKDASIAQFEKNEVQQQTIIKQQRYLAYGLAGLLVLLSGFGYLFWKQRKLKNQYEKENLEQRLLRTQMNPHFIGNAMNTVSGLVEKNSKDTVPFINKLSNLFRLMLTNSREELVSLEEELIIIKSYLELQSNFSQRFNFNVSTQDGMDLEALLIPPMLIQPLVENAIVHGLSNTSQDKEVTVRIVKDTKENLLKVVVEDNGNGFDQTLQFKNSQNEISISGNIIKERLQILKKKFRVNSRLTINSNQQGTKVELYLPYLIDV